MKIKKLYDDKNIMVVDKPAGVAVHGDGKTKQPTVSEYVLKNFKKLKGVGENMTVLVGGKEVEIERPGIVHRLDKDTSGALIIAKNNAAYKKLKNQFQDKKIKKEYIALVWGTLKHDTGIIDLPIARSKGDFRKKSIVAKAMTDKGNFRGVQRDALTRYKVLGRGMLHGEKVTLATFFPETGRTHQIRIHAKSIGHPIVGDHLYGPIKNAFEKKIFGKNKVRHLLHAKSLTFHNPENGEMIKVESPLPKELQIKLK